MEAARSAPPGGQNLRLRPRPRVTTEVRPLRVIYAVSRALFPLPVCDTARVTSTGERPTVDGRGRDGDSGDSHLDRDREYDGDVYDDDIDRESANSRVPTYHIHAQSSTLCDCLHDVVETTALYLHQILIHHPRCEYRSNDDAVPSRPISPDLCLYPYPYPCHATAADASENRLALVLDSRLVLAPFHHYDNCDVPVEVALRGCGVYQPSLLPECAGAGACVRDRRVA